MLRLLSITVTDFGPFKGEQTISFSDGPGLTIVYGENMRGKTSLLNAIRYAFFGKVIGRTAREMPLLQLGNWESQKEGRYGFKVNLSFESDGHQYELVRECTPRREVGAPQTDLDLEENWYLRRDGTVLSKKQKELETARIMPEQVSRFFLFDAELLQEYEKLVIEEESDQGRKIREAIERILGVPVLTNARADLRVISKEAQRKESEAAQKDLKTREIGTLLQTLNEQRDHYEQEEARLETELDEQKERKADFEERLKKVQRLEGFVQQRDTLQREVEGLSKILREQEAKLKGGAATAWRSLLGQHVRVKRSKVMNELSTLRHQITSQAVTFAQKQVIAQAIETRRCPVCRQPLDQATINNLRLDVGTAEHVDDAGDQRKLIELANAEQVLRDFDEPDRTDVMRQIQEDIERMKVDKRVKEEQITTIDDQVEASQKDEIHRLRTGYDQATSLVVITEKGIGELRTKIEQTELNIRQLQAKLDTAAGARFEAERHRRDVCNRLNDLFDDAVALYRDRLRKKVEIDATDLFRKLTTEPDYAGLSINENYGLTIVHKDGQPISVRSAGAEQVVALSLMGALQRNAPLQGPIVMDSSFGRMDEAHKYNIVRALPRMAEQVILLVFESELKPELARNELKGLLKGEYVMVRVTARHTRLEPR